MASPIARSSSCRRHQSSIAGAAMEPAPCSRPWRLRPTLDGSPRLSSVPMGGLCSSTTRGRSTARPWPARTVCCTDQLASFCSRRPRDTRARSCSTRPGNSQSCVPGQHTRGRPNSRSSICRTDRPPRCPFLKTTLSSTSRASRALSCLARLDRPNPEIAVDPYPTGGRSAACLHPPAFR